MRASLSFFSSFLLLSLCQEVVSLAAVPKEEVSALHSLFVSTNGEQWGWRSPFIWNFTQDAQTGEYLNNPCYDENYDSPWEGLFCSGEDELQDCANQTCHVVSIYLFLLGLYGTLPPELEKVSHLQYMVLSGNMLFGEIPPEIGNLTDLEFLELGHNSFSSSVPSSISKLEKLQHLGLWTNRFSSKIPDEIGFLQNLEELKIDDNLFSGPLPSSLLDLKSLKSLSATGNLISGSIPEAISMLSNLDHLGLKGNILESTVPPSLGNLSLLEYLDLGSNRITGSLPTELQDLSSIKKIWLVDGLFTGCIPPIGSLTNLDTLALSSNFFSCSIPDGIINLTSLVNLQLEDNALTGSIPQRIGNLIHVSSFRLYQNQLTGSIPSSLGNMTSINYFGFFHNQFTGSLPSTIGSLENVNYLGGGTNHLSGSLPHSICSLLKLATIEFPHNELTGTIPDCMGDMNLNLNSIVLYYNHMTGSIPLNIGKLTNIHSLSMSFNFFSGVIPRELGELLDLTELDFSNNALTGPVPSEINSLLNLQKLLMPGNSLTGKISDMINSSLQLDITVIDISDNKLSGSLPDDIFKPPKLETLALSVNCFSGSLPDSLCAAESVAVLSLDGLGAAEGCKDSIKFPFTGVAMFNFILGTIPACIWSFPNLRVAHLSGNGMAGKLEPIPNYTRIEDLAMSHNQISGTIPPSMEAVSHVDLSFNQLSGGVAVSYRDDNHSSLKLRVNRLSGHIPDILENFEELEILEGNIFSCDSHIPQNDEYHQDFVCGSSSLDGAVYGMIALCAISACIVVFYFVFNMPSFRTLGPCFERLYYRAARQKYFLFHLKRVEAIFASQYSELLGIIRFGRKLVSLWHFILRIAVLMIILGVPIYALKRSEEMSNDYEYSTHTNTYRWFWTFAYISGQLPAAFILLAWMVVIVLFFVYFMWVFPHKKSFYKESVHVPDNQYPVELTEDESHSAEEPMSLRTKWRLAAAIAFNTGTVIVMNAVYVYSNDQELAANVRLIIQFGFAVFNVMYGLIALPLCASPIKNDLTNINFRLWLLKFNNLFVPCIVTFLSSSSCMQGLLVESDPIISQYTHEVCDFWVFEEEGGRNCDHSSIHDVDVVPMVPPFVYHFQCGSVFLTLYIPVYIYMYSFQLLIPFIYMMLLSLMEYETIPSPIRPMVPAIIWPKYILKNYLRKPSSVEDTEDETRQLSTASEFDSFLAKLKANPSMLYNTKTVVTFDILHNISVLFTFGLCSPFLTIIISLAMILKTNMWLILLGRFLNLFKFEGSGRKVSDIAEDEVDEKISAHKEKIPVSVTDIHPALIALKEVCIPLEDVFRHSVWPIVWSSALFFSFLCWDLSADKAGWKEAIWIPCVAISFPVLMWIGTKFVFFDRHFHVHRRSSSASSPPPPPRKSLFNL